MRLRLSHKLIGLFVLIGLTPFVVISGYAYLNSKSALEKNARDRLAFVRESSQQAISSYLDTVRKQILTKSEDLMTISAMIQFSAAYERMASDAWTSYEANQDRIESRLRARYDYQSQHTTEAPEDAIQRWWPKEWLTLYLQDLYISDNPYPIGEKDKLMKPQDDSFYNQLHARYHPVFQNFLKKFGYYDIFLVDAKTGTIVYSVFKELDYATSLLSGPYAETNFGRVFKQAAQAENADTVFFADFEPYAPSYNLPAAFVASPIFKDNETVGVLIFQLPIDRIDAIMTNNRKWEDVGLGETGESILVGPDLKMRNDARAMIEEPEQFYKELLANKTPEKTVDRMRNLGTNIGVLSYDKPAVMDALQGGEGIVETKDYHGHDILAAYSSLPVMGTVWAVLATIEVKEAYSSLLVLGKAMGILGLLGAIAVVFSGFFFARSISKPLNEVITVLSTSSTEIATTINQQEAISAQQSTAVQETNTTMEELGSSSKLTADQADSAASGVQQVLDLSDEGRERMEEMVEGMVTLKDKVDDIAKQILHLSEQTGKIGEITGLVSDFANETKMLAMNAAVEAVRAGEHGKGFSVLSVEIRKLADESKRSAERIANLVQEIQKVTNATVMATEEGTKNVERGMNLARSTAETFDRVNEAIGEAAESTQQISLNVQQQHIAVEQVVEAMNTLNQGARENAAGIHQIKEGIETLNDAAQKLKRMV